MHLKAEADGGSPADAGNLAAAESDLSFVVMNRALKVYKGSRKACQGSYSTEHDPNNY